MSQQAIQAGHACLEYARQYGLEDHHPTLIFLTVSNQQALEKLLRCLKAADVQISFFEEPYKDWGLTAGACLLDEEERHLLSHLQLWSLK